MTDLSDPNLPDDVALPAQPVLYLLLAEDGSRLVMEHRSPVVQEVDPQSVIYPSAIFPKGSTPVHG